LFGRVFTHIEHLEALYTRRNDPFTPGQPKSHQDWRELWDFMKSTERSIDAFLDDGGFHADDLWRLKGGAWNYRQWLMKL
jgi:hypothetical protein